VEEEGGAAGRKVVVQHREISLDRDDSTSAAGSKRGNEGTPAPNADGPTPPTKAKHPNQYTYKDADGNLIPKSQRPMGPSPVKRGGPGSRRGGGPGSRGGHVPDKDRSGTPHARIQQQEGLAGYGLPDHLKPLLELLNPKGPQPLVLRTYKPDQPPTLKKQLPSSNSSSIQITLEPPTKIKFPPKRSSLSDLKKRSKHIMDYLGKIQLEMANREKRVRSLDDKQEKEDESLPLPQWSGSLDAIDKLTRDLMKFQDKYLVSQHSSER